MPAKTQPSKSGSFAIKALGVMLVISYSVRTVTVGWGLVRPEYYMIPWVSNRIHEQSFYIILLIICMLIYASIDKVYQIYDKRRR